MRCNLCDARCCKERLITITIFDVLRISHSTGLSPETFSQLVFPSILNLSYDYILECREGSRILALKSYPCYFLKDNKCSIYPNAPLICRLYPFSPDGKVRGMCPLLPKLLFSLRGVSKELIEAYEREDALYRGIVMKWNERGKDKSLDECWEFLLKEGKKRLPRGGFEPPTSRSPS